MGEDYVLGHRAEELERRDGQPAMLSAIIGSLAPAITGHGLADPAELDIAMLREQIAKESRDAGAAMIVATLVAAWGHPG
jgi:hypothetical protein